MLLVLLARGAVAQPPEPPARLPDLQPPIARFSTTLRLSAHATVKVAPDELVADLAGVGIAPTAVAAQRHVNEMIAKAKAAATGAPGVTTAFRDYSVGYADERPPHWTAQQTIEIRGGGGGGEATLDLVGRLQALGLGITNLGWRVSDERSEQARPDATLKALTALRKQAGDAAGALGMEVDRFLSVTLNEAPWAVPMQRGGMAAMPMAAAMPPPNATSEDRAVSATASAEVILHLAPTDRRPTP